MVAASVLVSLLLLLEFQSDPRNQMGAEEPSVSCPAPPAPPTAEHNRPSLTTGSCRPLSVPLTEEPISSAP